MALFVGCSQSLPWEISPSRLLSRYLPWGKLGKVTSLSNRQKFWLLFLDLCKEHVVVAQATREEAGTAYLFKLSGETKCQHVGLVQFPFFFSFLRNLLGQPLHTNGSSFSRSLVGVPIQLT